MKDFGISRRKLTGLAGALALPTFGLGGCGGSGGDSGGASSSPSSSNVSLTTATLANGTITLSATDSATGPLGTIYLAPPAAVGQPSLLRSMRMYKDGKTIDYFFNSAGLLEQIAVEGLANALVRALPDRMEVRLYDSGWAFAGGFTVYPTGSGQYLFGQMPAEAYLSLGDLTSTSDITAAMKKAAFDLTGAVIASSRRGLLLDLIPFSSALAQDALDQLIRGIVLEWGALTVANVWPFVVLGTVLAVGVGSYDLPLAVAGLIFAAAVYLRASHGLAATPGPIPSDPPVMLPRPDSSLGLSRYLFSGAQGIVDDRLVVELLDANGGVQQSLVDVTYTNVNPRKVPDVIFIARRGQSLRVTATDINDGHCYSSPVLTLTNLDTDPAAVQTLEAATAHCDGINFSGNRNFIADTITIAI